MTTVKPVARAKRVKKPTPGAGPAPALSVPVVAPVVPVIASVVAPVVPPVVAPAVVAPVVAAPAPPPPKLAPTQFLSAFHAIHPTFDVNSRSGPLATADRY